MFRLSLAIVLLVSLFGCSSGGDDTPARDEQADPAPQSETVDDDEGVRYTLSGPVDEEQGGVIAQSEDEEARRALEERLLTGRDIVREAPWTCVLSDDAGEVVISDSYSFLIDRSGTAAEGFFEWRATGPDAISVIDSVGSGPGDVAYTISDIRFESGAFEDDAFEGVVVGVYFEDGLERRYQMRCTRESPAVF